MKRFRVLSVCSILALAGMLILSESSAQGPGGTSEQGGRGGPGGGGGRRGFGFGGPNASSQISDIVQEPAVQKEIKLTSEQATKISDISEKAGQQRRELMATLQRQRAARAQNPQGNGGQGNANPGAAGATTGGVGSFGDGGAAAFTGDAIGGYGSVGGFGVTGAGGPQGVPGQGGGGRQRGGPGGGGPGGDFSAFAELTQSVEGAIAKVLTKPQRERVSQISLQRQGTRAFRSPDVQAKLNMSEEQVGQIAAILEQERDTRFQAMRAQGEARRELFASLMPRDQNAQDQGKGQTGNQGNGRGNGQDQGKGQRRGQRGNFDPEAMRALMEKPEVKAANAKARAQMEAIEDQSMKEIGKVLSKKQKATFTRMLGEPFKPEGTETAKADTSKDGATKSSGSASSSTAPKSKAGASGKSGTSPSKNGTSKTTRRTTSS